MSDTNSKFLIDLDSKVSPATLAGMLGISTGMVYQGQQDGKLPVKTTTTYREALHHYIGYYKKKVTSRSTSMGEAKLAQDIRNGVAKEEMQWLEIKQIKEELVDITVMKELFEPTFQLLRSSLVNLARRHPLIVPEVDAMLSSLTDLGFKIADKAAIDAKQYVQTMLDTEYSLEQAEEEVEEGFELKEASNE
jgi:hypothetical protein